MKKLILIVCAVAAFCFVNNDSYAQSRKKSSGGGSSYDNAVGLRVDFGTGFTGVGPNYRHKFNEHDAVDAALLFFDGAIGLGGEYQYNLPIAGAAGLDGYLGLGPQFLFGTSRGSDVGVLIRPVAGLDYKINGAPIDVAFDWRPAFQITPGTDFTAARFGISARFTF